jgi:hypothetical protein
MELSAAAIGWWAAYPPDGRLERFRSISESGIRLLISDFPKASLTMIENPAGGMVAVTSLEHVGDVLKGMAASPTGDAPAATKRQRHRRRVANPSQ